MALYAVFTFTIDAQRIAPMLALTSPEKRCGKSTALEVLIYLVRRPAMAASITGPGVFRLVERFSPTLLIDEADTFLRNSDDLRGILNSGHSRATAFVIRCVGDDSEPRSFSTFAPKVLAKIGRLPDTLADRSIELRMRRKLPGENVERLRVDRVEQFEELRRKAARFAADHLETFRGADPRVPCELHDRAADNWRPLLSIAEVAGGEWPDRARQAAKTLSGRTDESESVRGLLLADLHEILAEDGDPTAMFTDDLLRELRAREDRPWAE